MHPKEDNLTAPTGTEEEYDSEPENNGQDSAVVNDADEANAWGEDEDD